MSENKKRIIQFDALRVIAAFAVALLHTSAQRYYESFPSAEWDARNLYDSVVRWAVPIFIMISGAFFLDSNKRINTKSLFSKYITRLLFIYVFWSIVYYVYIFWGKMSLFTLTTELIKGPYHFWFLKTLIGLYILVPLLRVIAADIKIERYFLALSIVVAFVVPMFLPFLSDFSTNLVKEQLPLYLMNTLSCYVCYFVLGHYLRNTVIKKNIKTVIYIFGILSIVAVCVLTKMLSQRDGEPNYIFYKAYNLFTLLEAVALFIFVKDIKISPKYHQFIINASKISLGIYILHPFVMFLLSDFFQFNSASFNPLYFIPVYALLLFVLSFIATYVLIRIPILRKLVT